MIPSKSIGFPQKHVLGAIGIVLGIAAPLIAQDGGETLDFRALPRYGEVALRSDFDEPYTIEMLVEDATAVDLFQITGEINNLADCAGFTTRQPILGIHWRSANAGDSLLFVFESDDGADDATLFIHVDDPDTDDYSSWCADDTGSRLNPMLEVSSLPAEAWIYIWVGSYYPGVDIPGVLYVFRTQNDDLWAGPSPTPEFGSIYSDVILLGGLLIEEYCRALTPNYPDARPLSSVDLIWGCWSEQTRYYAVDLTEVCAWQYGAGSYAVQTGNSFRTYACFRHGSAAERAGIPTPTPTPVKSDYADARQLSVGDQATVVTSIGAPLPVYREPGTMDTRFAQFPPSVQVDIIAGPLFIDGAIWWQVAVQDIEGWVIAYSNRQATLVAVSALAP